MNKTEKWIVGGLCALFLAMMGYLINQVDGLKCQMSDLKSQIAVVSTKLDMHMKEHAQQAAKQTAAREDP